MPVLLVAGLGPATARAGTLCAPHAVQLAAQAERSRWREHDAQSRLLVEERGSLRGAALAVALDCAPLDVTVQLAGTDGERDYDGRSTTGLPVLSRSAIGRREVQLALGRPFGAHGHWQVLLGWRQTDRRIADSGPVLGYPERFTTWQLGLGAGHRVAAGEGWQLDAEAALAAGPPGRLALQLPSTDPATLRLGRLLAATLAARLQSATAPGGWGWLLTLQFQRQELAAGAPQALTRNGLVVGGAAQPRSSDSGWTAGAALRYRFP